MLSRIPTLLLPLPQAAEAAAKAEAEEQAELVRGNPLLQEKLAAQGEAGGGQSGG